MDGDDDENIVFLIPELGELHDGDDDGDDDDDDEKKVFLILELGEPKGDGNTDFLTDVVGVPGGENFSNILFSMH